MDHDRLRIVGPIAPYRTRLETRIAVRDDDARAHGRRTLYRAPLAFLSHADRVEIFGDDYATIDRWLPPALTLLEAGAAIRSVEST